MKTPGARGVRGGSRRGRQLDLDAHAAVHAPFQRVAADLVGLAVRPADALGRSGDASRHCAAVAAAAPSAAVAWPRPRAARPFCGGSPDDGDRAHLSPMAHRFRSAAGEHLLVVPFSRIFDLPSADERRRWMPTRRRSTRSRRHGGSSPRRGGARPDRRAGRRRASRSMSVPVAISAAPIATPTRGSFGGRQSAPMTWPVAQAAIDRLLAVAEPDRPITVGFLGGEPFANPRLIHQAVGYASAEADRRGLDVRFSVTTNGTLLRPADLALMRSPSVRGDGQPRRRAGPSTTRSGRCAAAAGCVGARDRARRRAAGRSRAGQARGPRHGHSARSGRRRARLEALIAARLPGGRSRAAAQRARCRRGAAR